MREEQCRGEEEGRIFGHRKGRGLPKTHVSGRNLVMVGTFRIGQGVLITYTLLSIFSTVGCLLTPGVLF